jgi:hypothetical protein
MKPKLLLITAILLMLLSISPQASYAADDPRVGPEPIGNRTTRRCPAFGRSHPCQAEKCGR